MGMSASSTGGRDGFSPISRFGRRCFRFYAGLRDKTRGKGFRCKHAKARAQVFMSGSRALLKPVLTLQAADRGSEVLACEAQRLSEHLLTLPGDLGLTGGNFGHHCACEPVGGKMLEDIGALLGSRSRDQVFVLAGA